MVPPAMALSRGGADLQGGMDEARNVEVAALKRLFYASTSSSKVNVNATDGALELGLHLDVPLARWGSEPFVPHQQILLNIFQPEYTHMFEALLASPKPWLYMHVLLPGGIASLGNPDFALPSDALPGVPPPPPSLAPLEGTLMQVVSCMRLPDARLRLVVQGVGRATVVRGTQTLPYARGDVQLLPDSEALLDAARASRRHLLDLDGEARGTTEDRMRMVLAAAAAEDQSWRPYENRPFELQPGAVPPAYSSLDPAEADAAVAAVSTAMLQALWRASDMANVKGSASDMAEVKGSASDMAKARAEVGARDEFDRLCVSSERVASALREAVIMTPLDEDEDDAAAEAEEDLRTLAILETQVWLELDSVLRGVAKVSGDTDAMPAPIQLLGLLPPTPPGGWPESFALQRVVSELRKADATRRAYGGMFGIEYDDEGAEEYVDLDERYPPRRRAQLLSYSIWPILANYWGGLELQPALEAESTSDRLRVGLLRLRALKSQIEDKGYGDLI